MSCACKRKKEKSGEKSNQLFDRRNVFLEEKKLAFWREKEGKKRKKKPHKTHRLKRTFTHTHLHTQKLSNHYIINMDESWEELKRNAILLGSWIALIRASSYIFGAFQTQH